MTPTQVSEAVIGAISDAVSDGSLNLTPEQVPTSVVVERPRQREHGDWSTNVAMRLAKHAGVKPQELAGELAKRLGTATGIASAEVAGPGFINLRLDTASAGELARTIVEAGKEYGHNDAEAGKHINLEFVSANPTGPIHIGGVRWAAVGDSLARILEASGAQVTREYYFNDHGNQIDNFSASLLAAARSLPTPENGYGGAYIADIANEVTAELVEAGLPTPASLPDAEAQEIFRERGVNKMFTEIQRSMAEFGVHFDVFFHENSLHTSGAVNKALTRLTDLGHVYETEGATWLRTSAFGDDKDRVLIKSDGNSAYIAADVAYYLDKRNRGADEVIIMLGADHHGYIGRMMAVCAAFGDEPNQNLQILIGQLVNLVKNGEPVRMSKRAGNVVTIDDLVGEVGVDAARYSLARFAADSTIDLDLDILAKETNDNPVFYVQYAHSRTCAVDRNAEERGVSRLNGFDPSLLDGPADTELLGRLAEFPGVVAEAAKLREPHRIARYLEALSGDYHTWYQAKDSNGKALRVLPYPDEPAAEVHRSRLWLNDAVRQVLANGLDLLGVSAPTRM